MGLRFLTFDASEQGQDEIELDMQGSIRIMQNDITVEMVEVETRSGGISSFFFSFIARCSFSLVFPPSYVLLLLLLSFRNPHRYKAVGVQTEGLPPCRGHSLSQL